MKMRRPKPITGLRKLVNRHQPAITEVVREPTAGGVIFRRNPKNHELIEILLLQDSKGRWTIPKGHVEEGENPRDTARREITEETGLEEMKVLDWMGKINFRYRRGDSLVLMTTEIFLVQALGDTDKLKKEKWMTGLNWLPATEALNRIEYEDIGKLILLSLKRIRKIS